MTNLIYVLQAWLTSRRSEEGATMVEYGLVVAFIAIVALVGVKALGVRLDALFDTVTF